MNFKEGCAARASQITQSLFFKYIQKVAHTRNKMGTDKTIGLTFNKLGTYADSQMLGNELSKLIKKVPYAR